MDKNTVRDVIKNGTTELDAIYFKCGAKTADEKHLVRGSISGLYRDGELTHVKRCVWEYKQ